MTLNELMDGIFALNDCLSTLDIDKRYVCQQRNGYTAVDYVNSTCKAGSVIATVGVGTPFACWQAVKRDFGYEIETY